MLFFKNINDHQKVLVGKRLRKNNFLTRFKIFSMKNLEPFVTIVDPKLFMIRI
jgi:hypothetical protein